MQGFLTTITPFLFVNGALLGYYSQYSILFGEHIEQKRTSGSYELEVLLSFYFSSSNTAMFVLFVVSGVMEIYPWVTASESMVKSPVS